MGVTPASGFQNTPSSTFAATNAEAYEQQMGRWSRRLAPLLIRFGGLADGDRVLDVGCGTGSLALAVLDGADVTAVTGIDRATMYVEYACGRTNDRRVHFQLADACALPFGDASFDRAFSLLVLQFIPDAARAVAEMRRVVRPAGTVAAAVWDGYGGLPHMRLVWDIAAALDPSIERLLFRSLNAPDELAQAWRAAGLTDVEQTSLLIRMEYTCFEDYWQSLIREGPVRQLVAKLSEPARLTLADHVRQAYCANRPDGPRSFACVAWAVRGTAPG
jgi:ubiquinone/menaquinone biosynthesis C-methylase UbiE